MSGKQMLKLFKKAGWEMARISGSHHIMKKGSSIASIPVHANKDLKRGTERSLLKMLEEN